MRQRRAPSLTIEYVRQYLLQRGEVLLSKSYFSNREFLDVRCPFGHEYRKKFVHINRGQGCPECLGNPRHKDATLEHIVSLAEMMKERGVVPQVRKVWGSDIVGLRTKMRLTQARFADLLGVASASLRFWEHGRRPSGEVTRLLQYVVSAPDIFYEVASLHERGTRRKVLDSSFTERTKGAEAFERSRAGREMRAYLLANGWKELGIRSNGKTSRFHSVAGFHFNGTTVKVCLDGRIVVLSGYKQVKQYPSWEALRDEFTDLSRVRGVLG